jgi:FMN reductase (NADPH)/FMN reductase [NAD(P)H]
MNPVIDTILGRKSVRVYSRRPIGPEVKDQVLQAALRAPTAGNLMLYSIIEVNDQAKKDVLARTCDHQPFIARAPWVLLFLADYQRWYDYFNLCGVGEFARAQKLPLRHPQEGDLFMACCDALIAAQTAVIAAESFGIGSCYIGDIMERYEEHRALFDLPRFVFPICLLCFGYPTPGQVRRPMTRRYDRRFVVFHDRYRQLSPEEFEEMHREEHRAAFGRQSEMNGAINVGQVMYRRKFAADFNIELNRSVRAILRSWVGNAP